MREIRRKGWGGRTRQSLKAIRTGLRLSRRRFGLFLLLLILVGGAWMLSGRSTTDDWSAWGNWGRSLGGAFHSLPSIIPARPRVIDTECYQGMNNTAKLNIKKFRCFLEQHGPEINATWAKSFENQPDRGIVMMMDKAPRRLANAFVNLHVLRNHLKTQLPITITYWDKPQADALEFIKDHITNLTILDLKSVPFPPHHEHMLKGGKLDGWKAKIFSLYAAPYVQPIYLDADSMLLMDPDFVYYNPNYFRLGTMFFPEFAVGFPALHSKLGMPMDNTTRKTEARQFVINRKQHFTVLEWLMFLNSRDIVTKDTDNEDKETYKAAFYLAGVPEHFTIAPLGPGMALTQADPDPEADFDLTGYIHFAGNGSAMFWRHVKERSYNPEKDEVKTVTSVVIPSASYVTDQGLDPAKLPKENRVWLESGPKCAFSMHDLHKSSRYCAKYDTNRSDGKIPPPIFRVPFNSHLSGCVNASNAAFKILRTAKTFQGELFA